MKKSNPAHRPKGSINQGNEHGRNESAAGFRCSQGFNKVVAMLVSEGLYKSKADLYHEAVQLLALKKQVTIEHYDFWVKKIQ